MARASTACRAPTSELHSANPGHELQVPVRCLLRGCLTSRRGSCRKAPCRTPHRLICNGGDGQDEEEQCSHRARQAGLSDIRGHAPVGLVVEGGCGGGGVGAPLLPGCVLSCWFVPAPAAWWG